MDVIKAMLARHSVRDFKPDDNLQILIGVALGYPNTKSIINTYRSSRRPIQEAVTFKGL